MGRKLVGEETLTDDQSLQSYLFGSWELELTVSFGWEFVSTTLACTYVGTSIISLLGVFRYVDVVRDGSGASLWFQPYGHVQRVGEWRICWSEFGCCQCSSNNMED